MAAEEELQNLFENRKLSLDDYLNKYTSQPILVVTVLEDEPEETTESNLVLDIEPCTGYLIH